MNFYNYDVIVIGGGHAGVEAACSASRSGCRTLLLTHQIETVGVMSCNPAIGGIGKGQLVKEIDALGGVMPRAIDRAGIHWRTLNGSKGPAVRATRAQADRALYRAAVWSLVQEHQNLHVFQQSVEDVVLKNNKVAGVLTQGGMTFYAPAVVVTAGTFLNGQIHIGMQSHSGGRLGERSSTGLALRLAEMFQVGRLKTGTPPRIDARTIDFSKLGVQPSDPTTKPFSYWGSACRPTQVDCFIANTNSKTHEVIKKNLHQSPIYAGVIEGVGPRYCPSIEDKIVRFADKDSHQIFIEPEGLSTYEVYPNGISTSLPFDVQLEILHSIVGLENCSVTRPGYAIEYDFFDPRGLNKNLSCKGVDGLFFAGQINGTTGYEEAAAQGILAGINAACYVQEKPSLELSRSDAYLGVLVDDLASLGTSEPYRMFTSRAEYRLALREDNADKRLSEKAYGLGLLSTDQHNQMIAKYAQVDATMEALEATSISLTNKNRPLIEAQGFAVSKDETATSLLKRPDFSYNHLVACGLAEPLTSDVQEIVETECRYSGYLARQEKEILMAQSKENTKIPIDFDYAKIPSLSKEIQEKLKLHRPETLGLASRISGVTPAAVSILGIFLHKKKAA